MTLYRKWFDDVIFILISDGIEWCKENVRGPDITYSPFGEQYMDLALMTSCDHVIVTSGTFGWWGAWLAGGRTVYFSGYPGPNSYIESVINRSDYYPPSWIGLH